MIQSFELGHVPKGQYTIGRSLEMNPPVELFPTKQVRRAKGFFGHETIDVIDEGQKREAWQKMRTRISEQAEVAGFKAVTYEMQVGAARHGVIATVRELVPVSTS